MIKIAFSGDLHLGKRLRDSSNLKEYGHKKFTELCDKLIEDKVDIFYIVGDLFDTTHPPIDTLKYVRNELKRLKDNDIKLFAINGNHDKQSSYNNGISPLSLLDDLIEYHNQKEPAITITENVTIVGINYFEPISEMKNLLDMLKRNDLPPDDNIYIMASHIPIQDEIFGENEENIYYKDLPHEMFDYIILGDIHTPIRRELDNNCISFFTGSTNHTTIKEYIEKDLTYIMMHIDKKDVEIEHKFLTKPKIIKYKNKKDINKIDNETIVVLDNIKVNIQKILEKNPLYVLTEEILKTESIISIQNIDQKLIKDAIDLNKIIGEHYKKILPNKEYELLKYIVNNDIDKNTIKNMIEQ